MIDWKICYCERCGAKISLDDDKAYVITVKNKDERGWLNVCKKCYDVSEVKN